MNEPRTIHPNSPEDIANTSLRHKVREAQEMQEEALRAEIQVGIKSSLALARSILYSGTGRNTAGESGQTLNLRILRYAITEYANRLKGSPALSRYSESGDPTQSGPIDSHSLSDSLDPYPTSEEVLTAAWRMAEDLAPSGFTLEDLIEVVGPKFFDKPKGYKTQLGKLLRTDGFESRQERRGPKRVLAWTHSNLCGEFLG